jgi:hypothetical protein
MRSLWLDLLSINQLIMFCDTLSHAPRRVFFQRNIMQRPYMSEIRKQPLSLQQNVPLRDSIQDAFDGCVFGGHPFG